ncbi:D-glucuronyl C5-epimerase family protein [Flavivirga sp. 57AJ16]|uniref:D-glucuronyl C5-epimerase family protein n=1 Tax=Flavivirga sp. 57AJ16 TaxID=3025307 RepID=UPI0023667DF0|nr:D-glucuronyl C5-epimerase family protein [Flavivirga sp. 57AJ16]MDD7885922.1 D-glucuronyl C5-epimerase family protein [Flavivirga sp. 57AJ16]
MNFYFKLKHYLFLYFKTKYHYSVNDKLNENYWIKGYKVNIESQKWKVEKGIPLGLYNGVMKAPMKRRVHISGLCEYCFALKEIGREPEQDKVINFLLKNLDSDSIYIGHNSLLKFLFWKTYVSNDSDEYYVHGMGQGQILSLLTRYTIKNSSESLEEKIVEVSNSYLVQLNHVHGFVNKQEETNIILEEYPKNPDRPHVLNGWIYSLIGLHDYIEYASQKGIQDNLILEKKRTLDKSLKTLERYINEYDIGFWSLYNLPKGLQNICSMHYQEQHIVLLKALGNITNNQRFIDYSDIFQKQYNNVFYRLLALFVKVFISNLIKHKWIYKT